METFTIDVNAWTEAYYSIYPQDEVIAKLKQAVDNGTIYNETEKFTTPELSRILESLNENRKNDEYELRLTIASILSLD